MAEGGVAGPHGVLVVDDDEDIRDLLREVLVEEGYAVATACDGHQAMRYLAENASPVVMLLDLMMPVKSGWTVLSDLAGQPAVAARVRVVVVSAGGVRSTDSLGGGVDMVLSKPIDLAALLATVRRLTGPAFTAPGPPG